jgi:hypothetical protein
LTVRVGVRRVLRWVGSRLPARIRARLRGDAGMNTAEYAVGTLAAVAFAGLLLKVLTSDTVRAALAGVIQRALG